MNKKTLSLALTTLVSLAPLGHAHGVNGFGGVPAFGGGFRGPEPRMTAAAPRSVRTPSRLPGVSRNWDRRHVYYRGGHCYRFVNGGWFLFDVGLWPFDGDYVYDYSLGPVYNDAAAGVPGIPVVAQVQQKLDRKGYNAGPADGEFGPRTHTAIARYQRDHRLPVTGTIGQPLLRSLHIS